METKIPGAFIRGVRLFENLTREEIQQLLDVSEEMAYKEGDAIFDEGNLGRVLYVVIEGNVRISLAAPSVADTELMIVEPRGVFGESSFFHQSVHHASAHCLTSVRLICLRHAKYRELLQNDSLAALKLAANAADLLGERLQQTDEWIERMLQGRRDSELLAKWKQFRRNIRGGFTAPIGKFSP